MCNRAWRKAEADVVRARDAAIGAGAFTGDIEHNVEAVEGAPVWCRPCADRIARAVARLPELAAALYDRTLEDGGKIAATGQSDATRKATRAGSPSGSPAWDAVDELVAWATGVEDRLRAELGHADVPRGGTSTVVQARFLVEAVRYLGHWATALLSSSFAVRAGADAIALERRAERAAGVDRLVHRLPAPCPSCDRKALVREDGSEQVDCKACGRVWTEGDYRRLVVVVAADYQDVAGRSR